MARPPQDPQIRINEILDAAEPLFYSQGYHETAISDIAKKLGVAQGTIYYYFASKEDLLEALINREMADLIARIKLTVHAGNATPTGKMQIAIQTLLQSLHREEGLVFEYLHNERAIHFLDRLSRQGKQLLAPTLLEIIEAGNQEKCFRTPQPRVVVNIIDAILDSLITAIYENLPAEQLHCQFKLSEEVIAYALGAPKGSLQFTIDNMTP